MTAGAPRKPIEHKRRTGRSPGRDAGGRPIPEPLVLLPVMTKVPKEPETLGDVGRAAWQRLWTAGQGWLSATTDIDIMSRLCEAHDEREAMRDQIDSDGYMIPGSKGQLRPHPLLTQLRALETQMTRWESECGFTPSGRSKKGTAEVRPVTKLDQMIARRRATRKGSA